MIDAVSSIDVIKTHTGDFRNIRDTMIPIWNSHQEILGEHREDIMQIFDIMFASFKNIIEFNIPYIKRWSDCLKQSFWQECIHQRHPEWKLYDISTVINYIHEHADINSLMIATR